MGLISSLPHRAVQTQAQVLHVAVFLLSHKLVQGSVVTTVHTTCTVPTSDTLGVPLDDSVHLEGFHSHDNSLQLDSERDARVVHSISAIVDSLHE